MPKVIPKDANLVPENATSVYKGDIFEVFTWPQELYDGSTKTFEMLKRPDSVVAIAIVDGKVMYVYDEQPPNRTRISLPGGRVDEGEDWDDAVKREVLEETGYTFKNWRLVEVKQPIGKMEWFIAFYIAWDVDNQVEADPGPGEKIKLEFGTIGEARDMILNDGRSSYATFPDAAMKIQTIQELLALEEYKG